MADIFVNQAKQHGTNWQYEDTVRFAKGIMDELNLFKDTLGVQNFEIIFGYLPNYLKEMADSVITNVQPPSIYIDAFLSDFHDRISTLSNRGGPIFPDESTRLIIKAQIQDFVDDLCQHIQPSETITIEDLENIKNRLIQELYWRADHPLRSEFKNLILPTTLVNLKQNSLSRLSMLDFKENIEGNQKRKMNSILLLSVKRGKIRDTFIHNLISEWSIKPILKSSVTTDSLYDAAKQKLEQIIKQKQDER